MTYKERLLKDINTIFKLAMERDELNIALKAKELVAKITCNSKNPQKLDLKQFTNEELEEMLKNIESEL